MELVTRMQEHDYEQIVVCQDRQSGLKAIIVIHDTTLGPALGGTRMWKYASEADAFEDALRLARGMTYKNAAAGLELGGGKTVIIGDPRTDKNEEMFRVFGRYVQGLSGRYITAEDVGTTVEDMDLVYEETEYVAGVSPQFGSSGNPSPVTAYGVYVGMKAAAKEAFGTEDLSGKVVAVQGVGSVAYHLCRYLHAEGASLVVTDIQEEAVRRAVEEFGAAAVDVDEIYGVKCDIFAPCALGAVLNDDTVPRLQASVIAGAANNQLKDEAHGGLLHERGILYVPDYVINAGGVINIAEEFKGYNRERAMKKVEKIYQNVAQVIEIAKRDRLPTFKAADSMAEERIRRKRLSKKAYLPNGRDRLSRRVH